MKAIVYHEYGSPDVLQLKEVSKPTPKENEVLVKVQSASLNPAEWHGMRATIFIVRLEAGLFKPKHPILGGDFAGRVAAVGKNVTQFQVGDSLYGRSHFGGYAEYVAVDQDRLALMPSNLSFGEAAAVPLAAVTGLQGLRKGQIEAGQRVLINGASGGIGTFTVQMAKALGSVVTAVCSTKNLELVRSLRADHTVDYTREKLTEIGQQYDVIIDAVGNLTVADYERLLAENGRCVVLGFENLKRLFQVLTRGTWASITSSKKIGVINANVNQKDLNYIRKLIEAGKVVPVIDRSYPFPEIPEALRYLGKKRARGKVVISLA